MDELTSVYVQESREQLAEMEAGLLRLEQAPDDTDNLNAIFRAAHTIKGGAGVVECPFIVAFTHGVENLLDALRNGEFAASAPIATLLLACGDHLNALIDVLAAGRAEPSPELLAAGEALTAQLTAISAATPDGESEGEARNEARSHAAPTGTAVSAAGEADSDVESSGGGVVNTDSWHISVRFGRDVMRCGSDPLTLIRYLGELGEIIGLETIADAIPAADEMDPESCYLGFEVRLQTKAGKADIEAVFAFVRDDCELRILPPHSHLDDYLRLLDELPEDTLRLGEILVRCGALTPAEIEQGLARQQAARSAATAGAGAEATSPPLGAILVEEQVVHQVLIDAAVGKQGRVAEKKAREAQLVRVQADKLDQLIDLVGELVIAGASAHLLAHKSRQSELAEATSVLSRLVESIRDAALQLRMVQIGESFNRFRRVVRDVARELGKEIELSISGAETELDKTVVEKIGDPLMHLVRNSLDHGIEPAELRLARGKPAQGTVRLNAYHDSGNIVIEVGDDGGGINRERVRAKAIERELIGAGDTLTDKELINLIFEPGFSTAASVSKLSGRGVGMDVVRRNISALRGSVEVDSVDGVGTTFTIRLPLTLAIIDGFLVGVGASAYVIPLDSVVECIELKQLAGERNFMNLRGAALPFVRLRELFATPGAAPKRENIVVVQFAGQRAGIVVDQLLGEFQTVIKPLGRMFAHLRGIGGSTILGSGEVALILDVAALVGSVTRAEEARLAPVRPAISSPALPPLSNTTTVLQSAR